MIRLRSIYEGLQLTGYYTGQPSLFIELTDNIDGYLILENNLYSLIRDYIKPLSKYTLPHIVLTGATTSNNLDTWDTSKLIDSLTEDCVVTIETSGQTESTTVKVLAHHQNGHVITEPKVNPLTDEYDCKFKYTNDLVLTFPEYDKDSFKVLYDRLYIRPPSLSFQASSVTMGALMSELQIIGGILSPINDRLKTKCIKRIDFNEYR